MRHRVAGTKLGRTPAHRNAMFKNMVTSLILNDRIETTLPKAKELRRWADKMITIAKKNSVHARRQAMMILKDRTAMQKLFSTLVDRYKDRKGGYTRIMKLGNRHGDNSPMAIIEYLTAEIGQVFSGKKDTKKTAKTKEKKVEKKTSAKKADAEKKKVAKPKSTKKKTTTSAKTKKTAKKK